MSAGSTSARVMRPRPLYFREPASNFVVAHRRFLEAVADTRVARQIARGESGVGFVPYIGRDLMTPLETLEILFAPGAVGDEPIGLRIGDVAGKREIQAKSGLVDEIVHIGFVTAVVIAAEE